MLTPITSPRKWRDFNVYDFEWVPNTLEIRLCGVFDGRKYRAYRSVKHFISEELTHSNRGKWFYAHAGGLADFQFVLDALNSIGGYEVRACFSNSSAIIVHVSRGKNSWHFVDSYWLLRDKLENIGKWIGLEKGEKEKRLTPEDAKEFYRSAPLAELLEYNRLDCEILWKAICELQYVLWELGGQLQMTLASSAMNMFRRKFLKRDIETDWGVNTTAEKAYCASRVEVFQHETWDANYLDINSSFPYAMTKPCPGEFLGSTRHIPDHGIYIAHCKISIPDMPIPPTPLKLEGRIFFPVGEWKGWFSSVDVELLQTVGGKILEVYEVLNFAPFDDLSEYATTFYEKRRAAQSPFEKMAYKLFLNSLYGKFAEKETKCSLRLNPKQIQRETWEMLFPGAWLVETAIPIPHRHVPISVHITAIARRTLYQFLTECHEVHYCDTDGFSTEDYFPTGDGLGELKWEKRWDHIRYVVPKGYAGTGNELDKQGSWIPLDEKQSVKMKGFSNMTMAKFETLLEGGTIEFERMRRIKELARKGGFKPREETISKTLRRKTIGKRFAYPDGHTRAWGTCELKQYWEQGKL